jgi:hypothetical protein
MVWIFTYYHEIPFAIITHEETSLKHVINCETKKRKLAKGKIERKVQRLQTKLG